MADREGRRSPVRPWLLALLGVVAAAALAFGWRLRVAEVEELTWPQFMERVKRGDVESVTVTGRTYRGQCLPGTLQPGTGGAGRKLPGAPSEMIVAEGPDLDKDVLEEIAKHAALRYEEPSRPLPWR